MQLMLLLFIFLLSLFTVNGQTNLYLKSGIYSVQSNRETLQKESSRYTNDELVDNKFYYRIISFSKIPDNQTKKTLKEQGFELLNYLPKNSFFVKINKNSDYAILNKYNVLSLIPVAPIFKKDKYLSEKNIPAWALTNDTTVAVNILIFKGIDFSKAINYFIGKNIKVVDVLPYNRRITMQIPINAIEKVLVLPFVAYMEVIDAPAEPENLVERTNHRVNVLNSQTISGRHYNGSGVVVSLGDDGIIGPHIDYQGRTDQTAVTSNSGDHGDHVAGIIMGAGNLDPTAMGMAPGSDLIVYDPFDNIYNAPTDYLPKNVRITSTSYGNGCNAGYTSFANLVDQQVYDYRSLMHVFSAGNSGTSDCGYGAGSGWGNITGGNKSGKNVIAVGNLTYKDVLSSSSSRGPATDGRIKPDICAVGTNVYSTVDANSYANKTGTSMACPGISGTLAVLYEAYKTINSGNNPEAGLIKAILLNTAEDLGNPGPDYKHGWGRVNALRAVQSIENATYLIDSVTQNTTNTHTINVPANVSQLRVMVYWTDPAAAANSSLALINDIDITVQDPSNNITFPWVLDPTPNAANLNTAATQGIDTLNNMEQVTIDNPSAGNHTINVFGKNIPQGPQKYYVVYEFRTNDIVLTYPIGGEAFVPGETEVIRWDREDKNTSVLVEYTTDSGASWNTIATVSGALPYYEWTVPNIISGQCRIRLTQGTIQSESLENFTIIGVPQNLQIDWACPDSFQLSWSAVSGATQYEVSILGQKYMDSIGVTSATSFVYYGYPSNQEQWVSVKALGNSGIVGRRAFAINKPATTFNCALPYDIAVEPEYPFDNQYLGSCVASQFYPIIKLKNEGLNTITNIPVAYQFNNGSIVNETAMLTINPGDSALYQFTTPINTTAGANLFTAWSAFAQDANPYNDTISVAFTVFNATNIPYGNYSEDFENQSVCGTSSDCEATVCTLSANGWMNVNNMIDNIDWRVNQGSTPSTSTGPSVDYLPGTTTGKYIYTEASGGCEGMQAVLTSQCIDLSAMQTPTLNFAYNMYGSAMGSLKVIALTADTLQELFYIDGNQGGNWYPVTISLNTFKNTLTQIQFIGTTGYNYTSDIALDAISITDVVGISSLNNSLISVYPNPVTDNLFIQLNDKTVRQVVVYNTLGQPVLQKDVKASKSQIRINTASLSKGIYVVVLMNDSGKEDRIKIIKK